VSHTEFQLIGCPGGGKTTTLSTVWLPRAVEKWGKHAVAVCSMTKTAATEIASRDSGVPKESVGTLHALCFRALERPEIAEAHVDEWNAGSPELALGGGEPALDEPDMDTRMAGRPGDQAMAACQILRHRMVPREQWPTHLLRFQTRWDDWCQSNGYTDYTGLIERAIASAPVAPGQPRVLVVDEVQDSSALELSLVRRWAEAAEYVVMAGDPWQGIFSFRGADPEAFVGHEVPEENRRFLHQSHRCPRAVHGAAMKLVRAARRQMPHRFEPRDADGKLVRSDARIGMPDSVLRHIEPGRSTMLLASCGFHLDAICKTLRREGIPFHNPYRESNGRWNPLRGGAKRLASFMRISPDAWGDRARGWTWKELHDWADMLKADGTFNPRSKDAIRDAAKASRGQSEVPLTAMEIRGMFTDEAWAGLSALRAEPNAKRMIEWLRPRLLGSWETKAEYALKVIERRGPKAITTRPDVIVGTVHSVKGGESDRVLVFPDISMAGMREWVGSGRDSVLRQFYVAFTRSREELVLCSPSSACHMPWPT
jgi:superfamily I DNA/RNA helicase